MPYFVEHFKGSSMNYSNCELKIFKNLSWIPKGLGEIDLALGYLDENKTWKYQNKRNS